jgi:hypothetical protein
MQRALPSAVLALSASSLVAGEDGGANPLGAVYSLIDELAAKITKDSEAAAKAYTEYTEWCDEATKNTAYAIKTAEGEKAQLQAKIAELASDISGADAEIEDLAGSIAVAESELKEATAIRAKEAADFAANDEELVETVDALGRASGILSKEMAKNPASFAQLNTKSTAGTLQALSVVLDAASFNTHDQKRLLAFVQAREADDDEDSNAPAAAVYKSQSGSIVDVIEDLKDKAEDQLSELRKGEVQTKHNFEMLKSSLEAQINDDTEHLDAEKKAKATGEEDRATAEKDLEVTVQEMESSKTQLDTARSSCITQAADYEASVASRKEELVVIAKAKEILQGSTSGAESRTYSLLQVSQEKASLVGHEVVAAVKRLAKQQKSPALAQLASRILAVVRHRGSEDIFGKVKGLIQDMIQKLEKEAGADAEEKAYCDEQMAKTGAKKGDLEDDIAKMTTRIEAAAAKSAKLKEELQVLAGELAALAKEQAELDKIRGEEKSAYFAAKADLEQGLTGVRKALDVLQEYYAASASMLQEDQPAKPETFAKKSGAGGSIIDILQTVESDMATNLAKIETEEADAKADYDKVTQENLVIKTSKEGDEKYKGQEAKSLDKTAAEYKADRETASAELAAVEEYFSKVKDRCIAKPETYGDRKARRAAEIQGLKDALTILNEEAAFVQRRHRGHSFRGSLSAQ